MSQQDRVSKFCSDARFVTTVEVGQYFMTKDTEEFSHFTDSVACRGYTLLPREENLSEPRGWIRREHQNWAVWEVTTYLLQGKHGVVIRIEALKMDFFLWVRISHGLKKLVTNLNNQEQDDNEQQTSEVQFEDCALKSNVLAFSSLSKAKAKPQKRAPASSSKNT